MSGLLPLLSAHNLVSSLSGQEAESIAGELAACCGVSVYPRSITAKEGRVYFLGHKGAEKTLFILSASDAPEFEGVTRTCAHGMLRACARSHANAAMLRKLLPHTGPTPVGLRRSIGMGDRLGIATPGHIRAVRGTGVAPILAQQSIREMTRTQRTPDQVMDDATWGVFEEGWREGFGSDADHLKTTEDIDRTFAAGFCLFTIDPGEHVDNAAGTDSISTLKAKLAKVPWAALETTEADSRKAFAEAFHIAPATDLAFTEEQYLRAVCKYGRAVAHTARLHRHTLSISGGKAFELEMSVDETDSPTTPHEHFYVAHELRRLGVKPVSLAPRFIGDFEKGIDYKGDLKAFEEAFILHVKIARFLGPYKISIHSGSDKFSVYPIAAKHARDLIHVKTAGTSYLEATRAIAEVAPALFREILAFAFARYDEDKKSYHVSAELARVPRPEKLSDKQLSSILDINDGRQLLHVTFGSVLTTRDASGKYLFRDRFYDALTANEDTHYEIVAKHLRRHIDPIAKGK